MKRAKSLLSLLLVLLMCLQLVPAAMAEEPEAEPEEPAVIMPEEEEPAAETEQAPEEVPEEEPAPDEAPEEPAEEPAPAEEEPAPAEARAEVIFRAESEEILAALTVFDARGHAVPPVMEDGEPIPGMYELVPGKYTYSVAAEGYLPLEAEPLAVKAGESLTVTLALEPAPEEEPEAPAEEPEEPAEAPAPAEPVEAPAEPVPAEEEIPAEPAAEEPVEESEAPEETAEPAEEPAEPAEEPAEPVPAEEEIPAEPAAEEPAEEPEAPEESAEPVEEPAAPAEETPAAEAPEEEPATETPEAPAEEPPAPGEEEKEPEAEEPEEAPAEKPDYLHMTDEELALLGTYTVIDSGWCGNNVQWKLTAGKVLTIYGTGYTYDYNDTDETPWADWVDRITRVVVQKGVTDIGQYLLSYMSAMKSVSLPTTLKYLRSYSFCECTALTAVTLPASLIYMGKDVFAGCFRLRTITIPSKVTSMGEGCFGGCSSLYAATIKGALSSIPDYTFEYCNNLKTVKLPSTVRSIGTAAFDCCFKLRSISLPARVTSIGEAAFFGSGLTSIIIPNTLNECTYIHESAFECCSSLKTVYIPWNFVIEDNAFSECDNLTRVYTSAEYYNFYYQIDGTEGNMALLYATVTRWNLDDETHVSTSVLSSSKIKLTFNKYPYASGYYIYRYQDGELKATKKTTRNYFTDTGLRGGTQYSYTVVPYRKVGNYIYYGADCYSYTALTPLAKPTVALKRTSSTQFRVSWKAVSGAEWYRVYYYYDGSEYTYYRTVYSTSTYITGYPGAVYKVYVTAGNDNTTSVRSATRSLTLPAPNTRFTVTNIGNGRAKISWQWTPGVQNIEIALASKASLDDNWCIEAVDLDDGINYVIEELGHGTYYFSYILTYEENGYRYFSRPKKIRL